MLKHLFWNPQERRMRALWRLLAQFMVFFLITGCFGGLIGLAVVINSWVADPSLGGALLLEQLLASPALIVANSFVSLVAMAVALPLAGRFLDRRPLADFGFHLQRKAWWLDLGFGLALGGLLMGLIFLTERALGWVEVTGFYSVGGYGEGWPFAVALLVQLLAFVCVGIYEEALSRGYQLRNLAEGLGFLGTRPAILIAWTLSSAVFGLAHLGNPNATWVSSLGITISGILLGVGYLLTGELAIPIGLHITWNFFQGNVFGFPVSGITGMPSIVAIAQGGPDLWTGGAFGPEAGLVGLMANVVGILLTLLWVWRRYGALSWRKTLVEYQPET